MPSPGLAEPVTVIVVRWLSRCRNLHGDFSWLFQPRLITELDIPIIYIIIYTIEYTYMLCIVSIHILPNFRWNATVYTSLLTRVQCLSKTHHRIQFAWAVTPKYNKCAEMSPKGPPNTEFRTLVTAPWQPFVVVALTFLQIPWNAFIPIMIPLWHHFSRERLSGGFFQ